jgi:acyl-CoA reductase-like NAD-dependent aldehyde dehydrogenase
MSIAGRGVPGAQTLPVIDPATGCAFAQAPDAGPQQLDQAVQAARDALAGWSATPWAQRQALLRRIAQTCLAHQEALAALLSREQGKPLARARTEIATAAHWFTETAGMELPDEVLQDDVRGHAAVRRVPLGVVGALVPWNYPVVLAAWKIAPALLAGNTLVLKPSPYTPLTTLRIGELLREVLPPGVLNVVSGGDALGPWMSAHPGIDKLSFTGSSATGRQVMRSAAGTLKRLTLELGGNDAAIVMPDVDVQATARALFWGAFVNSGQICIAAKRIYVHEAVYERMAAAFVALARETVMGPGQQDGVELGPVQNQRQFDRLRALLADCRARGLPLLCGGEPDPDQPGYFFPVTVVDNPPDDAPIVQEEPFGPIVPLLRFAQVDEAVARANASPYGLAGSVWCRDEAQALAIARRLQTGTVWINEIQAASPHRPMAGHRQSGLGAENGRDGLLAYTQPQTITIRRDSH